MTTPTTPADAGQEPPGRRPPSAAPGVSSRRRRLRTVLAVLAALVALLCVDATLVSARVGELDVDLRPDGDGTTWVLVGLDSRERLPAGAAVEDFGSPQDVPGSRADVIVVVHRTADGVAGALSIPRDLVVRSGGITAGRLALTWLDGPGATADALCTLGIPVDHLVAVDLAGFASVVDAVGGLDLDVAAAVRDPAAGLLLPSAGPQHVDGATALALVRSRHPERRVGDDWVPVPVDPDGRASAAGTVLSALTDAVHGSVVRPWRLQRIAWAASGAVTVDPGTSVADLISLARADVGEVAVLPVSAPVGSTIARVATDETTAAVAAAGLACER
ncbi:LCP family protein [Modestobacter lapidis]|nr:transcriptional regulator [Modestobacter lapidis]